MVSKLGAAGTAALGKSLLSMPAAVTLNGGSNP